MFGKLIGAAAGAKAASQFSGIGGTGGALLGVGAATLAKRLSPLALVALAVGGYALKRRRDKQARTRPQVTPSAS